VVLSSLLIAATLAHGQSAATRLSTEADAERTSADRQSSSTGNIGSGPGSAQTLLRPPTAEAPGATQPRRTTESVRTVTEFVEVPPPEPSEFERYVNRLAFPDVAQRPGETLQIRRLGSGLVTGRNRDVDAVDFSPLVPPDYLIAVGDEIVLSIWGSVDGELRLVVDRSGRITVPRVGAIMVAGVRFGDLASTITQRVSQMFKNFQLSVSLGQLSGVRVYVTGFAVRPGGLQRQCAIERRKRSRARGRTVCVGELSRHPAATRQCRLVSKLDFYDLLLKGDRSADKLVQADDVIHIGAIGPQVGVIGSVNRPAIYELVADETMADVLRMAAGVSPIANTSKLAIERVAERDSLRVVQVDLNQTETTRLANGDVVRVFNAVTVATPIERQNKRVRVEGEVRRPGDYIMPAESTIDDALRAAGGLTSGAFVFGTDFTRESVRQTQQENYERALKDLETELSRSSATQRISTADEAAAQAGRTAATTRLVERLRSLKPTGRVVLQLDPKGRELPRLTLEDGDRIYIPPVPTSIGVFGSVFNAGNYLREPDRNLGDYLRLAGGPTRGADKRSTFVIRANGTVVSNFQDSTWLTGLSSTFEQLPALPGDTVYVPEQADKTSFVQDAKDWTQILYQFALGAAAFVTLTN
jgi:protein involved in polysaccharide export with SLBB domain